MRSNYQVAASCVLGLSLFRRTLREAVFACLSEKDTNKLVGTINIQQYSLEHAFSVRLPKSLLQLPFPYNSERAVSCGIEKQGILVRKFSKLSRVVREKAKRPP